MVREGYPASTIEEYLDTVPPEQGAALRLVRDRLLEVVPDAEQVISYQVPTVRYRGTGLVALSDAKTHCSLHLMSPRRSRRRWRACSTRGSFPARPVRRGGTRR